MRKVVKLEQLRQRIEEKLNHYLPNDLHEPLSSAMRYSTLGGGKRLRAMLVYATGIPFGAAIEQLDINACAIECIHAYSLIHDDLPSMDNDDLRRGKATSHIKFDEATAILAGDALLTYAFELLSQDNQHISTKQHISLISTLAQAAGVKGMVGGQMLDILATRQNIELAELKNIHQLKTSALIKASIMLGALASNKLTSKDQALLENYAENIGLAFQIVDDILDETADTKTLGKQTGADKALGKSTYTALLGLTKARQEANQLIDDALQSLRNLSHNTPLLEELALLVINRVH